MATPIVAANQGPDPLRTYLHNRVSLANKRADMRSAAHELRTTLRLMSELVGRCLEAEDVDAAAIEPLEHEYEAASVHLCALALSIRDIAATLKVSR